MLSKISRHRHSAYIKQSGHCYYCNFPMWESDLESYAVEHNITRSQAKYFRCTAEHLRARSDGGSDQAGNIVAACIWCNRKRHARKLAPGPKEYRKLVQQRLSRGRWFGRELLMQHTDGAQMVR